MSGFDQITGQSAGEIPLFASDPTLKLSVQPYNRFWDVVSFATLLLLTQFLVCCIDQLNSRPIEVSQNLLTNFTAIGLNSISI
jgi:hypothetical protein